MIANKKVDGEFPICGQRRQIHENLIKKWQMTDKIQNNIAQFLVRYIEKLLSSGNHQLTTPLDKHS